MSEAELRETPLAALHKKLGASFTSFAGWRMPVTYSTHLKEHIAVRTSVALFDLSHMGEIAVTGTDAARFLDFALVVDASAMVVGRARYTLVCTPTGGILDDVLVYHTDPGRFLIIANASNVTTVTAGLSARATGYDVEVADVSDSYALVSLQGPASAEVLDPLCGAVAGSLKYFRCIQAVVAGRPALLARTGYTGEIGFEIYLAPADAPAVWTAIQEAGAPAGIVPAGLASRDTLRLEAGMALYGHELTIETSPLNARLEWAIPSGKQADYVGRGALERIAAEGADPVLVGLAGEGRRAARAGCRVLDTGGTPIGEVTSGVLSPTLGYPIAMAYVPPAFDVEGMEILADVRGQILPMKVVSLPFYRRG
jgi:aminomethyltransferase